MSIDPNELRRLHEAATPGEWKSDHECIFSTSHFGNVIADIPGSICTESREKWNDNRALIVYLHSYVPDILAALADRERLNKLESLLREGFDLVSDVETPGQPYFFIQLEGLSGCDEVYRGDGSLRAAIDAARSAK